MEAARIEVRPHPGRFPGDVDAGIGSPRGTNEQESDVDRSKSSVDAAGEELLGELDGVVPQLMVESDPARGHRQLRRRRPRRALTSTRYQPNAPRWWWTAALAWSRVAGTWG
jgi:hypothetical protein